MCGIAGFLDRSGNSSQEQLLAVVQRMSEALRHRGPDACGQWAEPASGLALGHRRLAIIDLSPNGAQPMHSRDGRFVISFNGEIYNYPALRRELEGLGSCFRSDSDTEVMLESFVAWGVEAALKRFVGMFAFALWDRQERTLTLARDRVGEKPLYYGLCGPVLLFGSELKALRRHPAWLGEVERRALPAYLRWGYIPAPWSIYRGIAKLPPGSWLTVRPEDAGSLPEPRAYWSMSEAAQAGARAPFTGSDAEAEERLHELLCQALQGQMLSDVPLGAFLSGGIDSSTVVALMQAAGGAPVRTFTAGFWEPAFNEAEHARRVAEHLGTRHTELYVSAAEALDLVPRLPELFDEPFGDASQIPTHLIARKAREHVTVCLSADAGDELFLGYNSYFWSRTLWQRVGFLPPALRRGCKVLNLVPPRVWSFLAGQVLRRPELGHRLQLLGDILSQPTREALFEELVAHWKRPHAALVGGRDLPLVGGVTPPPLQDGLQRLQYLDAVRYLPDDILVKVDRAAMGVSLETRVPFLDHRVVEFAWSLPLHLRWREGRGKWLLRRVLDRYVPRELIERPKMGFSVPLADWLRGPLREWGAELLAPGRLRAEGFLEPTVLQRFWQEHQSGARDWKYPLWDALMFQAWLEGQGAV